MNIGTPINAFQYAIQTMRETGNKMIIKENAEIIKMIREDVEYA